jgi:pimeloyl-ACP methyl ester carboxylesterase
MTASPHAAAGRHVDANGARLYVEEHGRGDPLVLAHMGLGSSATWAGLVSELADHVRVITVDTRGHGHSTNPSGELTYELIADDLAALIAALDLDHPFVGGWSDGGEVALQFDLRHPGRARGLIAGGTSLEIGSEATRAQARDFFHAGPDGVVDLEAFAGTHAQTLLPALRRWHPEGEGQWQAVVQLSARMWTTYPGLSRDEVERITAPVLVVLGDRDEHYSVEDALRLFRWLPNAELAILPGSDHLRPIFDPPTFARAIVDFVQRH